MSDNSYSGVQGRRISRNSCPPKGTQVGSRHSLTFKSPQPSPPFDFPGCSPDFHATQPHVRGQSTPVIPRDTAGLQQHLQLLEELRGQPAAGNRVFMEGRLGRRFNLLPHNYEVLSPTTSAHIKSLVACTCDLSMGERETGRSLGLGDHLELQVPVRDFISKTR